jgi:hypothetical protein
MTYFSLKTGRIIDAIHGNSPFTSSPLALNPYAFNSLNSLIDLWDFKHLWPDFDWGIIFAIPQIEVDISGQTPIFVWLCTQIAATIIW